MGQAHQGQEDPFEQVDQQIHSHQPPQAEEEVRIAGHGSFSLERPVRRRLAAQEGRCRPRVRPSRRHQDLEPSLDDLAGKAFAKLGKAVRELPDEPADEELHAVRKKGKRARYAGELAGRKKSVKRAKRLQDVLGEHQDAVVAAERLRELSAEAPSEQALVAGRLIEREQARRAEARAAWTKAWKRLRKTI
jgi:CHAD domain-containing protein